MNMNGNRKGGKLENHMHTLVVVKSGRKSTKESISVDLEAIKMVISISPRLRRQTPIYMDVIIMILHRSRNKIDYCDLHEQCLGNSLPLNMNQFLVRRNDRASQS